MKVGRSVDNCSSLTGERTVGVPSVGADAGGGVVGELELQPDRTTRALSDTARRKGKVIVTTGLFE